MKSVGGVNDDALDRAIKSAQESAPLVVLNVGLYNERKARVIIPADATDEELLYIVSVVARDGRTAAAAVRAEAESKSPIIRRPALVVPGRN